MPELFDTSEQFENIKTSVSEAVRNALAVEGKKNRLVVKNVHVEDKLDPADLESQLDAKLGMKTWGVPLYADIELQDKSNPKDPIVLDKKRVKLLEIPKLTPRYSFIVNGSEFQVSNQLRLKPGVYVRKRRTGETEAMVNLEKGKNFDVHLSPDRKKIIADVGTAKINVYSLLHILGVHDREIETSLGPELHAAIASPNVDSDVLKLYQAIFRKRETSVDQATEALRKYYQETKLSPEVTLATLGKAFNGVEGDLLLRTVRKLVAVNKGEVEPDDRDEIRYKKLFTTDDLLEQRISKNVRLIQSRIKMKLDGSSEVDQVVQPRTISKLIYAGKGEDSTGSFFNSSSLSQNPDQTNPVSFLSGFSKVTYMGEGGIKDHHAITLPTRNIHPTHAGFLDPVHTPECFDVLTQVFTSEGWKSWPDVSESTYFACRVEGRLEFHRPSRVVKEWYKGLMYGMKAGKIEYLVTPNHRVLCRPYEAPGLSSWRVDLAAAVHGKPRMFPCSHEPSLGEDKKLFELPEVSGSNSVKNVGPIPMEDWAEFMGWYLSEGSATCNLEDGKYCVIISQDKKANPEKCERIEALLSRLPFTWHGRGDERGYSICYKQLATYLAPFGFCQDKYIPDYFFGVSIKARENLLEALLLGDGRIDSRRATGVFYKQRVFCTTSPRLAFDFERLAISLGCSTRVAIYKDPREERYLPIYEVRLLKHRERVARKDWGSYYTQQYDGMVYCATVPGELLLVRRNDSVAIWSGNSQDVGIVNHLPIGVSKRDGQMKTKVQERGGKVVHLTSAEAYNQTIAMPSEMDGDFKAVGDRVAAYHAGRMVEVEPSAVTHRFIDPADLFGISTNLIPFLSANQGARAMMGAKMMEQALPLKDREAPFVQARLKGSVSTDQAIGSEFSTAAPVSGTVTAAGEGMIKIKDDKGKTHEVQYYHNFPLNGDVPLHSDLRIKAGDKVKEGQLLADSNFTQGGTLAIGRNLKTAFLPYKGLTFEDGVVISESAAKKLTSEHLHRIESPRVRVGGVATVYDKDKFISYFPGHFTSDQLSKLDGEGVAQKGAILRPGDPVIVYLQEKTLTPEDVAMGKLRKSLVKPFKNKEITWDLDDEGEVVRVTKTSEGPVVWIRTEESMRVGDKLAGRHGNKGVVTAVIPDREMPHDGDGSPVEILMDPHGIPSRINVGQIYETVSGKIAKKTGKPVLAESFVPGNYWDNVTAHLKEHGLTDSEMLTDPLTNEDLGKGIVGYQYIMKLKHQVRNKFSGRSTDKYTMDNRPAKGGDSSAQSLDPLKMFSMLAHGAKSNIREMSTYKAENNDDFWMALQNKQALPTPKPTFAWEKFVSMMRSAGVNVQKEGDVIRPIPMTDDEILTMSSGVIEDAKYFRAKDLRPEKGGLFDPVVTGGVKGGRWGHIPLNESMPNPVFEDAIRMITGLTETDLQDIIAGRTKVDAKGGLSKTAASATGGAGVEKLLASIDVDAEINKEKERIGSLKGSDLNRSNRKIRILQNLKSLGLRPEQAFILHNVPVLPPKYRPVYPDQSGIIVESPINHLYKNLILGNMALRDSKQLPDNEDRVKAREELYNALQVFQGWAEPTGARKELMRGIFDLVASTGQPKGGYFQSKLLSKRQDISGRSTIIQDPDLHMDQVGIPKEMAWKIFEPFVVQDLVSTGYDLVDAKKLVQDRDPRADSALHRVTETRPVLLNRAPSLHKHSILAFRPFLVEGNAIHIPPLPMKGFNADIDGDTMSVEVPITREAVNEAFEMLPSRNMLSTSGKILTTPSQSAQLGLYIMTQAGKKTDKTYKTDEEALFAHRDGKIAETDLVKVDGSETTVGRILVNKILPAKQKDPEIVLDKKKTQKILEDLARNNPQDAPAVAEKLKDLGFRAAYDSGFSLTMEDFKVDAAKRDPVLKEIRKKIREVRDMKVMDKEKDSRIEKILLEGQAELQEVLKKHVPKENNLGLMVRAGARGDWGQIQQMVSAPVAVEDALGKIVPALIGSSYSEGLTPAEYWSALHGARKGMIERTLRTSEPGALNKSLLHTTVNYPVTEEDCGTKNGVEMSADNKEIVDRYLAKDADKVGKRDDMVTPQLADRMMKAGVKRVIVRSPITCESAKGVCQMCAGADEYGKPYAIGANLGAQSAQAVTEPTTQMTMSSFHSGGIVSGEDRIVDSFKRAKALMEFPDEFPEAATLAEADGNVESISARPLGGWNVVIGGKGHYVPPDRKVTVKQNEKVDKGTRISNGVRNPEDVLRILGHAQMRAALVEDLADLYKRAGPYVKQKHFETVVRAITDSARITDAGDSDYVVGDVVPFNQVRAMNMKNVEEVPSEYALGAWLAEEIPGIAHDKVLDEADLDTLERLGRKKVKVNQTPIIYHPVLKGIKTLPLHRRDWLSQMAFTHIRDAIRQGVPEGWKSNIHEVNPIPGVVFGAEFGMGKFSEDLSHGSAEEVLARHLSDAGIGV